MTDRSHRRRTELAWVRQRPGWHARSRLGTPGRRPPSPFRRRSGGGQKAGPAARESGGPAEGLDEVGYQPPMTTETPVIELAFWAAKAVVVNVDPVVLAMVAGTVPVVSTREVYGLEVPVYTVTR